jgi:phytoene synthase
LGRTYFPNVDLSNFKKEDKLKIEAEIRSDFKSALVGIKRLPKSSRKGVYLAYYYYLVILRKITNVKPDRIMNERIRINNAHKMLIMVKSIARHKLNLL